ncbi:hypothetical protein [Halococcus agarilyticus]|uniref:hypothetical protein n=1 Tax=Halococcus agarilyticus TaxID=1232219 RepID=UPI000677AD71|nr:hypothetical protein [Halococcus agarilyticus]
MASDGAAWAGERVAERIVITHWLAAEVRKGADFVTEDEPGGTRDDRRADTPDGRREQPSDDPATGALDGDRTPLSKWSATAPDGSETIEDAVDALDDDEALDALLRRKPGAAAFLWRARPVEWSRIALRRGEFERLRFVDGPDGLAWHALAPSGNVMDGARRIAAGDRAALEAETGVDVERACSMAETLADADRLVPLVLTKRRGSGPPAIADGNHRATAVALHLLRTGEYRPQRAYLGIGANPVLEPLWQRIRGAFAGLRSDDTRW